MKKFIYLFIALMLAACGSQNSTNISSENSKLTISKSKVTVQSVLDEMEKGKYVQGQVLVKYKTGTTKASALQANKAVGASVISSFSFSPNLELVKLPQGQTVKDAIIQYMANPDVEYAEPNFLRRTAGITPNDTYFHNQYALENLGQYAYGTYGADIKASDAWRVSKGNYGIPIAVLDTGIDYSHEDLVSNMWRNDPECYKGSNSYDDDQNGFVDDCAGWNFVSCLEYDEIGTCIAPSPGSNDPYDDYGHGTHVAGIIGGVGNNGTGIAGVMWNALLMPVKVCSSQGYCADSDILNGLEYAMDMGAKAINASFGGYGESVTLFNAFNDAAVRGVLVIASAGNESNNNDLYPAYPASYVFDNIISVAATDQDDDRVAFSNFGIRSVDVAAPGVYIFSTVPNWWANYYGYGYFEFFDGTSMAAPHVTGLAGLLYSYYHTFNSMQIRNMILYYVDIQQSLDGWIATRGRINAWRAMSSLWEPYDLTLSIDTPGQVDLHWTDIATDELHYLIERKPEGGAYALIATLDKNVNSYSDTSGLAAGTKYFYRIRLSNWIGESPGHPDNERSITVTGNSEDNHHSSGGGGCSIGAKQNLPTAAADLALLLVPFIAIAIMRRRT